MDKPFSLVIEDDKNLAMAFSEALTDAGYDVEVIYDGQTALSRVAATLPATVVLDLHIPNVRGEEVLKVIRADPRLAKTRIIIATADDLAAARLEAQATLILLKPIGYQQLRDLSARLKPKTGTLKPPA
jgi:CheY-like chemotaxis protein